MTSVLADRELVLEAISLRKDFRLGGGQVVHAVRDVSFGLYRGTVVALVGESGSGKSTAARLLAGQERPSGGSIALDGAPVSVRTRRAFRRYKSQVQYVFQDPFSSLNPVHTVRYHLSRPVRLHQPGADLDQTLNSLMEQVRLTPAAQFLAKYPHELSGGQRQRVSFARALAAQPSVLLADEPVSMLDVSIRLEMLSLLDDLRTRLRLALLYITHDIASARYFADEILVMYAGQIVERGPAEEITQQPRHPYTQLLIAAAPGLARGDQLARGATPGAPADIGSFAAFRGRPPLDPRRGPAAGGGPLPGPGCPFAVRCPLVTDQCRAENPALVALSPGRSVACWRADETNSQNLPS